MSRTPIALVFLFLLAAGALTTIPAEAADLEQARAEAADVVARVGDVAATTPSAPGAIGSWIGACAGEAFEIWGYRPHSPAYLLAPVLDRAGEVRGYVGLDPVAARWQWYVEAPGHASLPITAAEARASARARVADLDPGAMESLKLVGMPDRRVYWYAAWGETGEREVFVDAWDASRCFTESTRDAAGLTRARDALGPSAEAHPQSEPPGMSRSAETVPAASGNAPAREVRYPEAYDIISCPHYYQITDYHCGPASLRMVFDYWDMAIGQVGIGNAANCRPGVGTYADDLRRAGHFSHLSTAILNPNMHGYEQRPYGYASQECSWSYGGHYASRYSDLKELVSSDIPVLVLTWYDASHSSGHFRVVKGYSDPLNVFIVHDPWYTPPYEGPNVQFEQSFLVDDLWAYSGRWGMTSQPWTFEVTMPDSVAPEQEFTVLAAIAYPGAHPFEAQYPATAPQATIQLPAGLTLAPGESATKDIPGIGASGTSGSVSWQVMALSGGGTETFIVSAIGTIQGSSRAYPAYEDEIGGVDTCSVVIAVDQSGIAELEPWPACPALLLSGPNPFLSETSVALALSARGPVRVSVHDAAGRTVRTLLEGDLGPGRHTLAWAGMDDEGRPAGSGIYYIRVRTPRGETAGPALVLLR